MNRAASDDMSPTDCAKIPDIVDMLLDDTAAVDGYRSAMSGVDNEDIDVSVCLLVLGHAFPPPGILSVFRPVPGRQGCHGSRNVGESHQCTCGFRGSVPRIVFNRDFGLK